MAQPVSTNPVSTRHGELKAVGNGFKRKGISCLEKGQRILDISACILLGKTQLEKALSSGYKRELSLKFRGAGQKAPLRSRLHKNRWMIETVS